MRTESNQGVVFVLNAGSSSIKFAVYSADGQQLDRVARGEIEAITAAPRFHAQDAAGTEIDTKLWPDGATPSIPRQIAALIDWIEHRLGHGKLVAAGHRVVLGGLEHTAPALVDAALLERLRALVPLAPVHQPRNLEPIEVLARLHPKLKQVACFDTAFHRTMPEIAQLYGLPRKLTAEGARRYGFHGLSYEYIARVLPGIDKRAAIGRTVVAHLGSGASMCALVGGRSVATTMGFSPLSGMVMGTRPGELDPGVVLWLMQAKGMNLDEVETMLYHDCGLKGVSGLSGDVRDLLASHDPQAKLAIDLFVYRLCWELGALAAAAGGLDALVFTAGIGEHAWPVREAVCRRATWLGIELDESANRSGKQRISTAASPVSVFVIPTDEELMIATHTLAIATGQASTADLRAQAERES
jgi:acetate kinase